VTFLSWGQCFGFFQQCLGTVVFDSNAIKTIPLSPEGWRRQVWYQSPNQPTVLSPKSSVREEMAEEDQVGTAVETMMMVVCQE